MSLQEQEALSKKTPLKKTMNPQTRIDLDLDGSPLADFILSLFLWPRSAQHLFSIN